MRLFAKMGLPLGVAAALLATVGISHAQTPIEEQDREWVNIAPDTLQDKRFWPIEVGYAGSQRVIYASTAPGIRNPPVFIKSADNGSSWKNVFEDYQLRVLDVSVWSQNPNMVYATTYTQLYKTTDGGQTWRNLSDRVEQADLAGDSSKTAGITTGRTAISPFDSTKVFLVRGSNDAYALTSDDGGQTWRGEQWSGGSHGAEASLAVSQKDSSRAYVWVLLEGLSPYWFLARTDDWGRSYTEIDGHYADKLLADGQDVLYSGEYVSYDEGQSWERAGQGVRREVRAVAKEGAVAIATGRETSEEPYRYYVSYDRGRSFEALPDPPPFDAGVVGAGRYELDARDTTLFVASREGLWAYARPGVFKTSVEEPEARPTKLKLEGYPNPFRESAILRYELLQAGEVHLAVYDVLGRKVRTLVDARQKAGGHRARFPAGDLPAGIYLVRLQAARQSVTRRLTLVR